jgi:hypothetical protein
MPGEGAARGLPDRAVLTDAPPRTEGWIPMLALLNRISKRNLIGAAGACGVALLTLTVAPPALAEDDDEETFEQSIIRNLLGGGSKPGIDYRERSPLVIPPARDLPPPDSGATVDGAPAWPRDPDQRKRASTRAAPAGDGERSAARHLRPDEMRRGTVSASRDSKPYPTQSDNDQGRPLRPAEYGETRQLFNFFATQKAEAQAFKGEPPRTRMTEPPTGYRTPVGSQPYQEPKEAPGSWFKAFNIFDRGTQ